MTNTRSWCIVSGSLARGFMRKGRSVCHIWMWWGSTSWCWRGVWALAWNNHNQRCVDISLNHDDMSSFSLHKWPWLPKSGARTVKRYKGESIFPWDSIPMAQTLCICLIWMYEAVWGEYLPQSWRMATFPLLKWTLLPKSGGKYKGASIRPWDSMPMAQTLSICLIWMYEAVWGGH